MLGSPSPGTIQLGVLTGHLRLPILSGVSLTASPSMPALKNKYHSKERPEGEVGCRQGSAVSLRCLFFILGDEEWPAKACKNPMKSHPCHLTALLPMDRKV